MNEEKLQRLKSKPYWLIFVSGFLQFQTENQEMAVILHSKFEDVLFENVVGISFQHTQMQFSRMVFPPALMYEFVKVLVYLIVWATMRT